MTLKDILNVLNMQVKYRVTDRFTREEIKVNARDKDTLNRKVCMIFQDENGLNITLF